MQNQISHHIIDSDVLCSDFLQDSLSLERDHTLLLFDLGAIYVNKLRILCDQALKSGDYLRLHFNPRRYSTDWNWQKLLIFENSDFLILNKPSGIPCHPTLDNFKECILTQLETENKRKLYLTHRLDLETSGLMLFAKTKDFQRTFNQMLADSLVEKYYSCVSQSQPALGTHQHFMESSKRSPKVVKAQPTDKSDKICILEVMESREGLSTQSFLNNSDIYPMARSLTNQSVYISRIKLVTGRTHQIRAQVSSLGHPILGDLLYGGMESACFGLQCQNLAFRHQENQFRFQL